MAYTPELSYEKSCVLRRIAWFRQKTMTKTIAWVFDELVKHLDCQQVCNACKDKTQCKGCPFSTKGKPTGRL